MRYYRIPTGLHKNLGPGGLSSKHQIARLHLAYRRGRIEFVGFEGVEGDDGNGSSEGARAGTVLPISGASCKLRGPQGHP